MRATILDLQKQEGDIILSKQKHESAMSRLNAQDQAPVAQNAEPVQEEEKVNPLANEFIRRLEEECQIRNH